MDKKDTKKVSLPRASKTDSVFKKASKGLKSADDNEATTVVIGKVDNDNDSSIEPEMEANESVNNVEGGAVESESDNEEAAQKSDDVNLNSDECEKISPEKSMTTQDVASSDVVDSAAAAEATNQPETADEADKPTVPIQTYLWEDVKRSKEQGGYPWTHLYKQPYDPAIEPEVILNYKYSPRSRRKGESYPSFDSEGSPEKVQSHDDEPKTITAVAAAEPIVVETESSKQEEPAAHVDEQAVIPPATSEPKRVEEEKTKEIDSISRKSSSSKIDSGSLKRKIKNPLDKIKKMADNISFNVKKVKVPTIPKYPFRKGDIVLNEELKIGKLKESPKADHREITSYVFKHQDSDESTSTIDIVELDESPMETRRRLVRPDEIIDLPKRDESVASTIDTTDITVSERSSSQRDETSSKKSAGFHGYADIESYISQITTDIINIEHVDRSSHAQDFKLTRQDDIVSGDPIFDEFSREMNKSIKKSLSAQDEKMRHELGRRVPKMEDLGMQSSEEDKLDDPSTASSTSTKVESKQTLHLLAPISSIDSTSSDEHSKAHLSILAEESESSDNKRKSFETEPSVDAEIESLKNDNENSDAGSDISTTLIEDEMKALEHSTIVVAPKIESTAAATTTSIGDEKPTITVERPIEMEKKEASLGTTTITISTAMSSGNDEEEARAGEDESKLELESNQQTEDAVKEDIIVKNIAEPATKISSRWSKIGDHDYEPIGEPQSQQEEEINLENDPAAAAAAQKRKIAEDELNVEIEKKLLKTSTLASSDGDNVSAQDIQDAMESHFFKHEIKPIVEASSHAPAHQENTFDEAVIIDESPVKREIPPKKRNFMASAQETGKTLQKKMKASAGALKTSINNKLHKNAKPPMPTVSVTQHDDTEPLQDDESQQMLDQPAPPPPKNKFNFKVPNLRKINMPDKPNFKINERFTKMRQLGRSKSMPKDESEFTEESASVATPEITSAEPISKKKFDFGTYPRLIRDKFKRPKLPAHERSDVSVRSDTPPALEFTNEQFARRGPVASRWPEFEHQQKRQSGQYQQFASESSDYNDRELSLERRMRMDDLDRTTEEREDFAIVARLISEEQRQLSEMDKENQEIHAMARQERYNKTAAAAGKQPIPPPRREREPSADVAGSADEWSGMLNRDVSEAEFELQNMNALKIDNDVDINRSYTPQTNQETQSSGSSGVRRRIAEGFDDDDEDYFMRSSHKFTGGEDYLDNGIKEGLGSADGNALMQIGEDNFDNQQQQQQRGNVPDKPTRSSKRRSKMSVEKDDNEDYFRIFPPARPSRKSKQSESDFGNEDEICDEIELDFRVQGEEDDEYLDDEIEYHRQALKGLEHHPDLSFDRDDFDNEMDGKHPSNMPVPPTPPRRRKKKVRGVRAVPLNDFHRDEVVLQSKNVMGNNRANVYCSEPHIAPLVQEEHYTTPTPTPRTRSRSNFSSRTLDDAMSFQRDSFEAFHLHDNKENDYAQIRRRASPACPVRRKRSTKSLGAAIPHFNDDEEEHSEKVAAPPRPKRNYSTIPNRPPRRKSAGSLVEISKTIKMDEDDYEEIMGNDKEANVIADERLISGEIVSRMKDRPLPPPPRPKRENKRFSRKSADFDDEDDEKFDKDDNAEKIFGEIGRDFAAVDEQQQRENDEKIINDTIELPLRVETSFDDVEHEIIGSFEDDQISEPKRDFSQHRQESDEFSEPEQRVVEVEVSTQTDLPYEELIDEDEECLEEYLSADGKIKTLEDILKEEQEAEMERARWSRQLEEAENLSRGIERFRESNQRSFSEKSRTSGARSRSTSRPITPSAIVVEHRKSSPIIADNVQQTLTEAGLFVHPITYDDFGIKLDDEEEMPQQQLVEEAVIDDVLVAQASVESAEPPAPVDTTDVNNNTTIEREPTQDEVDNVVESSRISIQNLDREIEETFERISSELFDNKVEVDTQQQLEQQEFDEVEGAVAAQIAAEQAAEEFDDEMQRKIEEMIESVMNSAREEVDWIKEREQRNEEVEKLKTFQLDQTTPIEHESIVEPEPSIIESAEVEIPHEIAIFTPEPEVEESDEVAELLSEEKLVLIENQPIKPFEEFQPLEEFKPISPSPPTTIPSAAASHDDILQVDEELIAASPVEEVVCIRQIAKVKPSSGYSPPPQAPPRKKSSITTSVEDFINKMDTEGSSQELPKVDECHHEEEQELRNITHIEVNTEPSTTAPRLPSRLHIDTLEIDNLSVSSLQAGRISASEIDTHSIAANEFESKSANMPSVSIPAPIVQMPQQPTPTFTFPDSLIDEIVERVVRSTNQAMEEHLQHQQQQQQQQQQVPVNQQVQTEAHTAPPPALPQDYTTIPQSFYQLRDPSDAEVVQKSPQQQRRRRHQRSLSTSEEEYQREQRNKSRAKDSSASAGAQQQPSVAALGGQFLSACGSALREQGSHLMEVLRASSKDENKRDLHVAILILVIIVAGLFLMGYGDDKTVNHHWEFLNPPDHQPR